MRTTCPSPQTVPHVVSVWEFWSYPCAQRVQALRQFPMLYLFGNSGVIHAHNVSKPSDSSPCSICLGILELSMRTTCPSPQTVPHVVSVWEFWSYPCAQRVQALRQYPIQYLFGNSGVIHAHNRHNVSKPSDSSPYSICLGILELSMRTTCPSPQTVPYVVSVWEFWSYPCAQRVQAT